jgi:hypothetical protein
MMELPEEEIPPVRYWHHPEKIEGWFKAVRYHRLHPNESSPFTRDEDDWAPGSEVMQNQLVAELMGEKR